MNWRTFAEQIQRDEGRDNRDVRDKSPPIPPTVPNAPIVPLDPVRALRQWRAGLEQLDPCSPPKGWEPGRWQDLADDAFWLFNGFAEQAARDGWSALDLFGVHMTRPGWGGLCDRLRGARNLKMAQDRAAWSRFGVRDQFCRGGGDELVGSGVLVAWATGPKFLLSSIHRFAVDAAEWI